MTRPVRVGDAIAAATSAVGVRPCSGCKHRQEKLNRAFDPSAVSRGNDRRRAKAPALPGRLAASLLVGAFALTVRERLREHSHPRGGGPGSRQ
jgi:hypothetical protein